MDYAAHEDLRKLLRHERYDKVDPRVKKSERKTVLPEPMIWYTFQALVNACLVLEQGSVEAPVSDWNGQVVHCDIKLANIVLDVPTLASGFPSYPTPKLADSGMAIETTENDPRNPSLLRGGFTRRWGAPEQFDDPVAPGQDEDPGIKLLAATNVYAIGLVM
ncbi:hypothetical protein LTR66_006869 [Elasticomyces elasticus]|nr:hypothetical protein LTR66_006869 [Elasticomyces elasticus]